MLAEPKFGYVEQPMRVVSAGLPDLSWKGVPHLKELDLSNRELTDRMIWVWSPNVFARENRPDPGKDVVLAHLRRGNRTLLVFARSPDYYEAAAAER